MLSPNGYTLFKVCSGNDGSVVYTLMMAYANLPYAQAPVWDQCLLSHLQLYLDGYI